MAAVSEKVVFRKKHISNDFSWNHDKFHRNFHFWIQNGRRYGKYVCFTGFFSKFISEFIISKIKGKMRISLISTQINDKAPPILVKQH